MTLPIPEQTSTLAERGRARLSHFLKTMQCLGSLGILIRLTATVGAVKSLALKKANCRLYISVYNQTENRCLLIKMEILMNDLSGFGE